MGILFFICNCIFSSTWNSLHIKSSQMDVFKVTAEIADRMME